MISMKDWERYIARLKKISDKAAEEMQAYVDRFGFTNTTALINRAYALATKYGEAAGAAACDMYDAVAAISKASVPPAVPAETATYGEVAKAVNGALKAGAEGQVPQIVSRKVKQAGADTTLKNAIRDGAEFAWVPHGDTCAFCITLASRGWQKASQAALKGGHAEHIHSNCDCEYAIRLSDKDGVRGYDPDRYKRIYYDHGGDINAIRREQYQKNKEKINAQKRAAYYRREMLKNPSKYGNIIIDADEFVPCLRDNSTGKLVDTVVARIDRKELSGYNKKSGWYVNWNQMPKDASIYKLTVKGDSEIQGLIAMTPKSDHQAMFLNWIVSAPHNNPLLLNGKPKRFEGVGGHLMAIAAKESLDQGFGGAAYGFARNKELMQYYIKQFGATHLPIEHPFEVYYDEDVMMKLLEVYNYEKG